MHDTFEARNELEEKLLATQEGQMSSDEFMKYLMDTQVFMPVKDSIGIEGFTSSDKALPLSLIHISEPTRQYCQSRMPSSA